MKFKKVKIGWPLKITVGWELVLSCRETHKVAAVGATAATLPGVPAAVRAVVAGIAAGLVAICAVGGHDGVRIIYSFAMSVPVVLPR
jgi:hypothetical protein